LKTGKYLKELSRKQNNYFSMIKFKKSLQRIIDHRTLYIGSKSVNFWLLKHCNTIDSLALKSMIFDKYYIKPSTWHKIDTSTPAY